MEGEEIGLGPNIDTPVSGFCFADVNISTCPRGSNSSSAAFCHSTCYLTGNLFTKPVSLAPLHAEKTLLQVVL